MDKINNKGFAISTLIYGVFILFVMILFILISVMNSSLRLLDDKVNNVNNYVTEEESDGPNPPDLSTGLIPVVYDGEKKSENGTGWFVANTSTEWYNYDKQEWANGVSVNSEKRANYVDNNGTYKSETEIAEADMLAMFVWIPRYSYTIRCTSDTSCYGYKVERASNVTKATPGAIDIKFVSEAEPVEDPALNNASPTYIYSINDRTPDNWYSHPAFWWDENNDGVRPQDGSEELPGIWVGKFETSIDENLASNCGNILNEYNGNVIYFGSSNSMSECAPENLNNALRILPNKLSLILQNVSYQYYTAQKFTSDSIYGLLGDSHMMKNSEWGAVAYLSQSEYGKYGNSNYEGANKEIYINNSGITPENESSVHWARYTGRSLGTAPALISYSKEGNFKYDGASTTIGGTTCELCGTGASTTGNIYGIYDMSGGATEYVMGYIWDSSNNFGYSPSLNTGIKFKSQPSNKYFNAYQEERKNLKDIISTKKSDAVGHALYETYGWYNYGIKAYSTISYPWIIRGGSFSNGNEYLDVIHENTGNIFSVDSDDGDVYRTFNAFRSVLVSPN